jgi:hypothetical protein
MDITADIVTVEIQTLDWEHSVSVAEQGPEGIPGISAVSILTTPRTLGGNRVVTAELDYADCTDLSTINRVIGVTASAANAWDTIPVVEFGVLGGFSGLTPNTPIYLSTNGTVSHNLPSSGYQQLIGVAISTTKLSINIQEPLAL